MLRAPSRAAALLLCLAGVAPALAQQSAVRPVLAGRAPAPPAAPARDSTIPVIISASGGISRGAYQAGVNWALVQMFRRSRDAPFVKQHDLRGPYKVAVATGASAGNVNAALSAVEDCIGSTGTPEESLFWLLWANLGMDQLLGPSISDPSTNQSLLTRRYIEQVVLPELVRRMQRTGARTGCDVPIGITLTRIQPDSISIGDDAGGTGRVQAVTQRFATVFSVRERNGRLAFTLADSVLWKNPKLGKVIIGDQIGATDELEPGWVTQAMSASGAFPVAFQPITIRYRDADSVRSSGECLRGGSACTRGAVFMDGGLFDNNPLTLALDMYDTLPKRDALYPNWRRDTRVLFIDTDRVRGHARQTQPRASDVRLNADRGIEPVLRVAGGFLPSARQYELQGLARTLANDPMRKTWIHVTTRSQPMMGGYLHSFAAFLGRPLREYDFYTGIYDGLQYAARHMTHCLDETCSAGALQRLMQDSTMQLGSLAPHALRELYRAEYNQVVPVRMGADTISPRNSARLGLLRAMLAARAGLVRATETNPWDNKTRCAPRRWEEELMCSDGFEVVLDTLASRADSILDIWDGRDECQPSWWRQSPELCPVEATFIELVRDPGATARRTCQRLVHQLWRVEDVSAGDPATRELAHEGEMELLDFAYNAFATRIPIAAGFDRDPSSIQTLSRHWGNGFASWLPYWLSTAVGEGHQLGYRPTYNFGPRWAAVAPVSLDYFGRSGRFEIAPGVGVLHRRSALLLSGVEVNVQAVTSLKNGGANGFGATAGATAYLLADRFRVATRYVFDPDPLIQRGDRWSFSFGINDLNGLLYWGARLGVGEGRNDKAPRYDGGTRDEDMHPEAPRDSASGPALPPAKTSGTAPRKDPA